MILVHFTLDIKLLMKRKHLQMKLFVCCMGIDLYGMKTHENQASLPNMMYLHTL